MQKSVNFFGSIGTGTSGHVLGYSYESGAYNDLILEAGTVTSEANIYIQSEANGANIGVGTTAPARKLHISDAMRLEPISGGQPATPSLGDLYVDGDTNELCFHNGTAWAGATGGTCN